MGFRKGRSAESLLLKLTEKWKLAVDSRLTVGVVFIGFQKAYDTVSHDILAFTLQALGIAGNAFELIMSYLNDRHQYTELNGQKSETKAVKYRVPQGSLLGPRHFGVQVNDSLSPLMRENYHVLPMTHQLTVSEKTLRK